MKGMLGVPLEAAVDKQAIAGMAVLLQEIRRGPGPTSRHTPLYFVSASPSRMRAVIERKMLLDGVEHDGTLFKDWAAILRSLSWRRLREQLGFKLTALLTQRLALPTGARETLLGDDLETDALAFGLYADMLAGHLPLGQIVDRLVENGVARADAQAVVALRQALPPVAGVRRALIRLERHGDANAFIDHAPHLVACHDAFQMACVLLADGDVGEPAVLRVANRLVALGIPPTTLGQRLADLCRRAAIKPGLAARLQAILSDAHLLPAARLPSALPIWAAAMGRSPHAS